MSGEVLTFEDVLARLYGESVAKTAAKSTYKRTLEDAWAALNAWIEETVGRRRGVSMPSFARLLWEFYEDGDETRARPLFVLTEAFCRSARLPYKKPVMPETVGPCEEINYSKLALRFSSTLTKDMMFSAIRDIFRKVGELVTRGARVKLDLAVGALVARERKVTFVFDSAALKLAAEEASGPLAVPAQAPPPVPDGGALAGASCRIEDSPRLGTPLGSARSEPRPEDDADAGSDDGPRRPSEPQLPGLDMAALTADAGGAYFADHEAAFAGTDEGGTVLDQSYARCVTALLLLLLLRLLLPPVSPTHSLSPPPPPPGTSRSSSTTRRTRTSRTTRWWCGRRSGETRWTTERRSARKP